MISLFFACHDTACTTQTSLSQTSQTSLNQASLVSEKPTLDEDLVDLASWSKVLSIVVEGEEVNYVKLKDKDVRSALDQFIKSLAVPVTEKASHEAKLAYWINAYNALTLRHVLRYPGLKSVAEVPLGSPRYTFFKQRIHVVDGQQRSLDDLEHQILRPLFKDARVHTALNCASRSCPPLAQVPYRAQTINAQLDEAARRFVNDQTRNQINQNPPRLSKIFEWFATDFKGEHATELDGMIEFIGKYASPSTFTQSGLNPKFSSPIIKPIFIEYDWTLNGQAP